MGFCPKCGKEQKKFGLCRDCSQVDYTLRDFEITFCCDCKSYLYKNVWKKSDDEFLVVDKLLHENIGVPFELVDVSDVEFKPGLESEIKASVTVDGEEFDIPIKYKVSYCNMCKKKNMRGHEGILQFRGDYRLEQNKKIIDFINDDIEKNRFRGVHCVDVKSSKNAVDFMLTNKTYIPNLVRRVQAKFGGTYSVNEQLFSRDRLTSKDIYRLNVLYVAPVYQIGQVVVIDGKPVRINSMGKDISGTNLAENFTAVFKYREDYEILSKKETSVVKIYPNIEILDAENFSNVEILNKPEKNRELKIGEKVKYVEHEGKYYLV